MGDLTLEKVAMRRKRLVRHHLWDLPIADDINAWIQQFSSPEDKKIAMIALDALIVRSEDSAKSAIVYMLCSVLPNIIKSSLYSPTNRGAIPYDLLRDPKYSNQFRIQRLERPTSNPEGGQSSDNIIRDLKHDYSSDDKYFGKPDNQISQMLLVDEFSGSGNQAKKAIIDWRKHISFRTKISVFFMAIHEDGFDMLQREFPDISFYTTEILRNESSLLHQIKEICQLDSIELAKLRLKAFTQKHFVQEKKLPALGYRDMALCFKPPYTACNNMAGVYLLKTKKTKARLFQRGL